MRRRSFLAALGTAGAVGTAGCGMVRADTALSDPTLVTESDGRKSLRFTEDGETVGSLGASGGVSSGVISVDTQIWHREDTTVESIRLRLWMPSDDSQALARIALVSPVEGDSSPPPSVSLYTPRREYGTVIEVTDLDDLADETISTIELLVQPISESATTLAIDGTIELASTGWLEGGYTLDGQFELDFPELEDT